ncbi:MAG: hypothetical protein OXC40_04045 [Proteobacteria bacterium]|nr:hypothetical protein [Pseudomonadota bacterium]
MITTKKICYFLMSLLITVVLLTTLSTSSFAASASHNHITDTLLNLTADFLIDIGVDESEIVDVLSHEELSDEEQLNILFTYVVELSQGDDYSQQYLHLLQDELPATEITLIESIFRELWEAFTEAFTEDEDSESNKEENPTNEDSESNKEENPTNKDSETNKVAKPTATIQDEDCKIAVDCTDVPKDASGNPAANIKSCKANCDEGVEIKYYKPEPAKPKASKPEVPKSEPPKPKAPKPEVPKPEPAKPEAPKPEPVVIEFDLPGLPDVPEFDSYRLPADYPGDDYRAPNLPGADYPLIPNFLLP